MSGCLRKSLFSLMSSTFERLALLEAGGREGVATQVTCRAPRDAPGAPGAARGAREAPMKAEAVA